MDQELIASHLDAIYGVAREDFTAERDRRVKELRAAGHRDEAGALADRRKPTVPAWAVDRLARLEPEMIETLIGEADALREAQRRAASGRGSDGLREASRQVRELVGQLRDRARDVIEVSGGRATSHLDDVERTLFTAAVDTEHHEHLRRGWFATPLGGSGFGGLDGLTLVVDAPETSDDEAEQERRELERRQEALQQQRGQLQRSRERQLRRVERTEAAAQELEGRAAAARADAEQARAELARIDEDLGGLDEDLRGLGGGRAALEG